MSVAPRSGGRSTAILGALYFVQGMPYGFQTKALPIYLTDHHATMTQVSFAGALSLPWLLKPVWGPLVDRYGTRRRWIAGLQVPLALTQLVAAFTMDTIPLAGLFGLLLLMNFLASTQDVAVDGLAVDLLEGASLGTGNAAQVVGFKVGMLFAGGALVVLTPTWGWAGAFAAMAAATTLGLVALWPGWTPAAPSSEQGAGAGAPGFRDIGLAVLATVRSRAGLALLLFIATYKLGESMSDVMWKPFLQRSLQLGGTTVAAWDSTWGMAFSIAGSLMGGVLASRLGPLRAVTWCLLGRLLPAVLVALSGYLLVGTASGPVWTGGDGGGVSAWLIGVTCAEELTGGALTTTTFALMMSTVDRQIGATHFTALAAVEVAGKAPGGLLAGPLVDRVGFGATFIAALGLAAIAFVSLAHLRRVMARSPSPGVAT